MALGHRHVIIGGVTKSATTSLYSYLAQHPEIVASTTKETNYFMPARFDQALEPLQVYESYFVGARNDRVTMEASPGYFYGGRRVTEAISSLLPAATVVLCFREPVSRLKSFFHFHKEKALLPAEMPLSTYIERAVSYSLEDFRLDRSLERWFGVAGSRYDEYFPSWSTVFDDRLLVTWFDDLRTRPSEVVTRITDELRLPPKGDGPYVFDVENRTVRPRMRSLHSRALAVNDRLEPFLRRHTRVKSAIRSWYQAVNTLNRDQHDIDIGDDELRTLFYDSNMRFAAQLAACGAAQPPWLK